MNMTQDLSNYNSLAPSNITTRFVSTTSCGGLNTSSNHAVDVSLAMRYDAAIRFPLVDIITFWPNRSSGLQSYNTGWPEDVQVRAFCMTPDQIEQGSDVQSSGEVLLKAPDAKFRNITGPDALSAADTVASKHAVLLLVSAMVTGMMLVL
jgi:hypothetical protein